MAGDYTRMTFRPGKDHSGVLMQQGRVTLDSDWNELVELIDRRFRAETVDIIGRCTVPSETPDGFHVQVAGGVLTIGPGRAYVHGLLAENHGADPQEYDRVLGELRGTQPVAYDKQPYFPNATAVAPLPTSGTHVAYLDVWQREVTHLEHAQLIEKAIAIDTATRLQTAWQVRLLSAPAGTACDSSFPAWDTLTAPSAGRLTTKAVGVPAADDPCTIPPAGGYRGTENRLYRVEIHDKGPLGTATFKWSRDNASVASAVTAIDAARTELTLVRLGRDGVRRIRIDDWVEVIDDWRELNGLPGELRKVQDVDEVKQSIVLASALPAGAFDATAPARHTRVRKWDQAGVAVDAAGGVLTTPATGPAAPIVLEDGVQIQFDVDPAGGAFHVGDYWVFAARTVDASVEELVDEPPRGILHHYCRLAVITFPSSVTDCRTLWPPPFGDGDHGCDCTVCVTPESHASGELTIQKAIDMAKATGGKVCLQAGIYRLRETLRITGAMSLQLQGKGWSTMLIASGRGPAIIVDRSVGIEIDDLMIVTAAPRHEGVTPTGIAIAVLNTLGVGIERCFVLQLGTARAEVSLAGLDQILFAALAGRDAAAPVIVLNGVVAGAVIRENVIVGATGIAPVVGASLHATEIQPTAFLAQPETGAVDGGRGRLLAFGLEIVDNLLLCSRAGVDLEGFTMLQGDTRIDGNSVYGCRLAGIVSAGLVGAGGRLDIDGNLVRPLGTGIFVGTDDTRIVSNDIAPLAGFRETGEVMFGVAAGRARGEDGIVLGPGLRRGRVSRCQVLSNRVVAMGGNGIAIRTNVASALIKQNVVQGVGDGGIVMTDDASAETITIENNELLGVASRADDAREGAYAIRVLQANDVAVVGNAIAGVAQQAVRSPERIGIDVVQCETIRVSGNRLVDIGPTDEFVKLGGGVVVRGRFGRADVCDNSVRRSQSPPEEPGRSEWFGLLVGEPVTEPTGLLLFALSKLALYSFSYLSGRVRKWPLRGRATLGVRGNVVEAFGGAPAAEINTEGTCIFSDNRCILIANEGVPAARVTAGATIAGGNYLERPGELPAFELNPSSGPFTVLGNVATGPILVDSSVLGAPWNQLNVS
jgi:hypothetical protein